MMPSGARQRSPCTTTREVLCRKEPCDRPAPAPGSPWERTALGCVFSECQARLETQNLEMQVHMQSAESSRDQTPWYFEASKNEAGQKNKWQRKMKENERGHRQEE